MLSLQPMRSLSQCFSRSFSNSASTTFSQVNLKILVIAGNGIIANQMIESAIQSKYRVIVLTSQNKESKPWTRYVQVDRDRLTDSGYLLERIKEGHQSFIGEDSSMQNSLKIAGLNLIGDATGNQRVNIEIPLKFFEAMESFASTYRTPLSLGLVSSISVGINDSGCKHAMAKRQLEEALLEIGNRGVSTISIRAGMVLPSLAIDGLIESGHDYSPEQVVLGGRVFFVIGNGNQPMPIVSESDLSTAFINAFESKKDFNLVINGMNDEMINQTKLYQKFNRNGAFVIKIPYELAGWIGRNVPKGRLQEYAVTLLKNLEDRPELIEQAASNEFEALLGYAPQRINEIYPFEQIHSQAKSPILRHMFECAKVAVKSMDAMKIIFRSLLDIKIEKSSDESEEINSEESDVGELSQIYESLNASKILDELENAEEADSKEA